MPKDRALREINEQLGGRTIVIGATSSSGGGAVTDHGTLAGLGDDDHPHYLNATRHAAIDADLHGSGTATDGQVLTADGAGGAAWEDPAGGAMALDDLTDVDAAAPDDEDVLTWDDVAGKWVAAASAGSTVDAADVTYAPTTAADWDGSADPGDVDGALDQLAERVKDIEDAGGAGSPDASAVTYTPTTATDWDSDADPGNVDDALDQLAERVDDLERRETPHMGIGARVYNDAAITHDSSGSWKTLTFNSEHWDTDSIHSTSTNTDRLTCVTAGRYLVFGHVEFAANGTGVRSIRITKNGVRVASAIANNVTASFNHNMSLCTVVDMAATDYVQLDAYQNSGGNLNITRQVNWSPEFGMVRIA